MSHQVFEQYQASKPSLNGTDYVVYIRDANTKLIICEVPDDFKGNEDAKKITSALNKWEQLKNINRELLDALKMANNVLFSNIVRQYPDALTGKTNEEAHAEINHLIDKAQSLNL